jgi:hypothetical protein
MLKAAFAKGFGILKNDVRTFLLGDVVKSKSFPKKRTLHAIALRWVPVPLLKT